MRKKTAREARESALASGWMLEADPELAAAAASVGGAQVEPNPDVVQAPDVAPASTAGSREQLSNGAVVLLGVIGGLYLLYTWVWFSWANYYSQMNAAVAEGSGVIGSVMQQLVFWAAPLAPALWFLTAFLLCRGARTWKLALWLLIGAVVLVPLPALVITGGA